MSSFRMRDPVAHLLQSLIYSSFFQDFTKNQRPFWDAMRARDKPSQKGVTHPVPGQAGLAHARGQRRARGDELSTLYYS